MYTCKICNIEYLSPNGFGNHIKQFHKIETKEYYDLYMKKQGEGKCIHCENPSSFSNISKGYRKHCSKSCSKKIQPNCKGWVYTQKEGYSPWNKGLKNSDMHKKNWKKSMIENGGWKNTWNKGKPMSDSYKEKWRISMKNHVWKSPSEETRKKLRLIMIEKLNKMDKKFHPPYNQEGCVHFNKLMDELKCFIQHAENGGEYYIKELGYWVDGFDKEHNVVYEFDEKSHYINGILKEKDQKRQENIVNFLGCSFIRIKSWI